jgi:GAF domain-containing protein
VGTLVSQSVANEYRLAQARAEAERSRTLHDLSLLLHAGVPLDALFDRLQELVAQAVGFSHCALYVRDEDGCWVFRHSGLPPRGDATFEPGEAAGSSRTAETGEAPGLQVLREAGFQRTVTAMLRSETTLLGSLTFSRRADQAFTPAEVAFIEATKPAARSPHPPPGGR